MLTIRQADVRSGDHSGWSTVPLPDTWTLRGLKARGEAEYRLNVHLDAEPVVPWALYAARLSMAHTVSVNGILVDQRIGQAQQSPMPCLVSIAPQMLRAGMNDIRIVVHYRYRGGLSSIQLGPLDLAENVYARARWLENQLPQQLNFAAAVFSLLLLLIWWQQPREQAVGLFGLLGLASAVRNYAYHSELLAPSPPLRDALAFTSMVWMNLLFYGYAYCMRYGRALSWRGPWGAALLAAPLLAFALPDAWFRPVRFLVYALLCLGNAWTLRHAALAGRQAPAATRAGLLACMAALFGAGLHDFAYQIAGWLPITHAITLLWAIPIALCGYSMLLLTRLFGAMAQVEELNQTLEARVRQRTQALQTANAARANFIATASHDLRQPLVSISLLWGLLQEQAHQLPEPSRIAYLLAQMGRALGSMEALLKSLLDFSRLETSQHAPALRTVPLAPLLQTIQADLAPQAAQCGLRLALRLPRHPVAVRSDAVLLEQIVRNLMHNALHYTAQGGVLMAVRRRRGGVDLEVWDTGQGISAPDQERIFEPFVQVGNPGRTSREGWGLGLAIVRNGARLLGHDVRLRSRPGRGSCFSLRMEESAEAAAAPLATAARPLDAPARPRSLQSRSVWVVEDEDTVRTALSLQLTQWGARVTAFSGARELRAEQDDAQEWPDLLICDVRLPDGNGLELAALLRQDAPAPIAALLVTGDTSPQQLAEQQLAGGLVLHKPFGTDALWRAIQAALEQARDPPLIPLETRAAAGVGL